jgi:hypothetical protein
MQWTDGHVMTCLASDCSYNCDSMCCAPEIMVGDAHPQCDMFTDAEVKLAKHSPKVLKCMVGECHFNKQSTCVASGITLTPHSDHADCATYRA